MAASAQQCTGVTRLIHNNRRGAVQGHSQVRRRVSCHGARRRAPQQRVPGCNPPSALARDGARPTAPGSPRNPARPPCGARVGVTRGRCSKRSQPRYTLLGAAAPCANRHPARGAPAQKRAGHVARVLPPRVGTTLLPVSVHRVPGHPGLPRRPGARVSTAATARGSRGRGGRGTYAPWWRKLHLRTATGDPVWCAGLQVGSNCGAARRVEGRDWPACHAPARLTRRLCARARRGGGGDARDGWGQAANAWGGACMQTAAPLPLSRSGAAACLACAPQKPQCCGVRQLSAHVRCGPRKQRPPTTPGCSGTGGPSSGSMPRARCRLRSRRRPARTRDGTCVRGTTTQVCGAVCLVPRQGVGGVALSWRWREGF